MLNSVLIFGAIITIGLFLINNGTANADSQVSVIQIGDPDHVAKGLVSTTVDGGPDEIPGIHPVLYSLARDDDFLRTIDPNNSGITTSTTQLSLSLDLCDGICPVTISGGNGLAKDPISGKLYAILKVDTCNDGCYEKHLVTINATSGNATEIGEIGIDYEGLAFNSTGTLFGLSAKGTETPALLSIINTNDATITPFIDVITGNSTDEAIAFNPDDGFLYHASGGGLIDSEVSPLFFEKIDSTSGTRTSIEVSPSDTIYNRHVAGITYSANDHAFFWTDTLVGDTLFKVTLVGPSITNTVNNTSPKWGLDHVGASGNATGFAGKSILIQWGDGLSDTIPGASPWGPVSHIYNSAAVGTHTVNATLIDSLSLPEATSANTEVIVQKHSTTLSLNQLGDVVAGTGVSAIGNLTDLDNNLGIDGKQITFAGTGATGIIPPVNTSGITFFDSTGMIVDSCPACTPMLGSSKILHLHSNSIIGFPNGTIGVAITLQDMGTNGFQIRVTNGLGVQSLYSGSASSPDITVFSPPSDPDGIASIEITSITGGNPGLFGISEIKTANPGGDPTTIYDTGVGNVALGTYSNLEVLAGSYSSIGPTSSVVTSGLTVQASFAGDAVYSASSSSIVSYSTIIPTFGVGGTETSGIVTKTATPFTTVFCSNLDPDTDRDSLCNSWESGPGVPYTVGANTFHYPLTGANQNHKDIFVEADAMNGVWSATYQNSINDVITAFTKAPLTKALQLQQKNPDGTNGINLHVITDETNLHKTNALAVWTDTDTNQTNDYFSIKASHFGTALEHPSLGGTQVNGPASSPASLAKTITISGLTLTTPTLVTKGDNLNSAAQGTITIVQTVNFGAAVTITTPIASPVQTGAAAGIAWGVPSTIISAGAGTAQQTITTTIPFTTTGPVTAANVGTISITLQLSASTTTASVATALNSPSVSDTLLQAKAQAYRYALFVDCLVSCGAGTNPSGLAEQTGTPKAGNDVIVGLGPESGFTLNQNNIAGTFMHELGHTLGLQHGGPQYTYVGSTKTLSPDSSQNCKPNYESVMSYSRQFVTYLGSNWILNYSSGTFGPLTETGLSELAGLVGNPAILSHSPAIVYGYNSGGGIYKGTTSATVNSGLPNPGIDWDKSGTALGTGLSLPIQDLGFTGCSTATPLSAPINDYNDWLNLNYNFTATGSFNGIYPNPIYIPEVTQQIVQQQLLQVTPHFITKWGSFGDANGQLKLPSGAAADSSGNVYVADTGNSRIEKFTNTGTFITKWGSFGTGNNQFKLPTGVTVDSSGNVYVADTGNSRIEKWAP